MKIRDKEVKVDVDDIDFWGENEITNGGMGIYWSGNIGFGQLDIYKDKDGKYIVDTECMSTNDDKEFINLIFSKLIEKINVIG
jgi:hypothetical protein